MTLTVSESIARRVAELVDRGEYPSHDAVLGTALDVLEEKGSWSRERLIAELQIGIDELDQGLGEPLDLFKLLAEVQAEAKVTASLAAD